MSWGSAGVTGKAWGSLGVALKSGCWQRQVEFERDGKYLTDKV